MEYFKHDNHKELIKAFNLEEIRHFMQSLLSSVKELHDLGFIHKDLKMQNFLYNNKAKKGILIDYGGVELVQTIYFKDL